MLPLAADEDFNNRLLRSLLRRKPALDIIRVQDVGLSGAHDIVILEWAATEGRILLTHDVQTMTRYAYERIESGLSIPGVLVIRRNMPTKVVVEDILMLVEASFPSEWTDQVLYIPL